MILNCQLTLYFCQRRGGPEADTLLPDDVSELNTKYEIVFPVSSTSGGDAEQPFSDPVDVKDIRGSVVNALITRDVMWIPIVPSSSSDWDTENNFDIVPLSHFHTKRHRYIVQRNLHIPTSLIDHTEYNVLSAYKT